MKAQNIFANQVAIGGPVFGKQGIVVQVAGAGNVVAECVNPHVNALILIFWHGNAPRYLTNGARHANILQVLHHVQQFRQAKGRLNKAGGVE